MSPKNQDSTKSIGSATELRKMTVDARNDVLAEQAVEAEAAYLNDSELTDFEAFGQDDLYGNSWTTESG